jgi:hypothetical protein
LVSPFIFVSTALCFSVSTALQSRASPSIIAYGRVRRPVLTRDLFPPFIFVSTALQSRASPSITAYGRVWRPVLTGEKTYIP